jgi:hypothetical protein
MSDLDHLNAREESNVCHVYYGPALFFTCLYSRNRIRTPKQSPDWDQELDPDRINNFQKW